MKQILLLLAIYISSSAFAQNTILVLDTLHFANTKYYEGQKIRLGQGTNSTKDFSFISAGKKIDSLAPLPASFAMETLTIRLVYKNDFGYVIVASQAPDSDKDGYILIRVEQALTSKEMMVPTPFSREMLGNVASL
jgi:hypothetical protein